MTAVIRQFYVGMRACVRNDNGDCSEEFNVEQGLREGCVISLLLINIFFAAVLLVALQRFNKDLNILADLVRLREHPAKVGPETAMECVRRSLWGMLYADDACVVSRSSQGIERMMATLADAVGALSLTVSEKNPENYELADPTCPPRKTDSIHHNRCDYGKLEVISRGLPPDPCGLDEFRPLSSGVVRPPHGFARPQNGW